MIPLRIRATVLAATLVLGLGGGLAAAADTVEPGFKKPRAEVLAAVKTIGLLPVDVTERVPNTEAVAERYESLVSAQLEQAGFQVVKPAAMREIRERLKKTLGGLYDPVTGHELPGKVKAFEEYSRSEYLASHKVDATLWVGIIVRRARMSGAGADWDGVSETVTGHSGVGGFLTDTFSGNAFSGVVPALSVGIVLTDTHEERLYERAGGLQLLEYVRREGSDFVQPHVDPRLLMTDAARDTRALAIALDPLAHGSSQASKTSIQVAPIAPPAKDDALAVPREELLTRYRTVAIGPLGIGDLPQRDEVEQRYHALLVEQLQKLGFTVVGENDYAGLWSAEKTAAKGFYDPFTGRIDKDKLRAARTRVFAQLHDKYPIDAVVLPSIAERAAPFSHTKARWDGVAEAVAAAPHGLAVLTDQTSQLLGTMRAASLVVRIAAPDDVTLFEDRGGIQLTERLVHGRSVDVPEAELLTDAAKNAQAVEAALRQLAPAPLTPQSSQRPNEKGASR
jgi:hypothetical protein